MELVQCKVGNASFRMVVSNPWERFRVETLASKEPETVRWILDNFRDGDTLLDVGANVGIYAILAAAYNRAGTVVAVEPMAATFARLCENSVHNELQNFRPYCLAIGAENGLTTLNLTSLDAASSMHSVGDSGVFEEPVVLTAGISVVTLDTLAATAGVPNLIKIDVDGGEDAVLAGAANVLRDPRLRSVLVEFNWTDGNDGPHYRDEPLVSAGFRREAVGIEYAREAIRWQNTIYSRPPLL